MPLSNDAEQKKNGNVLTALHDLDEDDPKSMDPSRINSIFRYKKSLLKRLVTQFHVMAEFSMIKRSSASALTNSDGSSIPLKPLFKKQIRKLAVLPRAPLVETEYQWFHLSAARYI